MHILGMRNWVIIISVRFSEMQNWVIMIRGSAPLNECKLILSSEWLWASKQQYIKKNFSYNTPHTNKFTTVFRGGVFLWDCRGCLCWMVLFWICRQVGYFNFWRKKVISWPWAKDVISTMLIIIIFIFQVHRSPTQIKVRNEWVWSQT